MLSSHWQLARACRALCTAAALALLPQGAAGDVVYEVKIDPPNGFHITEIPFCVTATVTPLESAHGSAPSGTVTFYVNFNRGTPKRLDNKDRARIQLNEVDLQEGWNDISAWYRADGGSAYWEADASYYYDPLRARAKSARVRADSAAQPALRATVTTLTPIPPNPAPGQFIRLNTQVVDCQDASIYPKGGVTFVDEANQFTIGPISVMDGWANLIFPAQWLPLGSSAVTAKFEGDYNFVDSSDWVAVTVNPPPPPPAKARRMAGPRAYRSGLARDKPRRSMRRQAPPGKGTR